MATPDGRARFSIIEVKEPANNGGIRLSTRRGKQFNSIVHRARDPLNGARRDEVLMNVEDARLRGLADGDAVIVRSEVGELRGRCRIAPIAPGNAQMHWPEGNALVKRGARSRMRNSGLQRYCGDSASQPKRDKQFRRIE